jgi:hypothetical protein
MLLSSDLTIYTSTVIKVLVLNVEVNKYNTIQYKKVEIGCIDD